ncbi:MAG: glutathione S-transferase N-terminal domain-containing protein [Natronospirillum sp.]
MTQPWFPNIQQWPVSHPNRLQLYTMATPNGQKVSIALEEMQIPYEWHLVNITQDDQHQPEYRKLSPNGKIPTILDPNGPDGVPIKMMESGAILIYLAEKSGQLMPTDERGKRQALEWLFFQVGHIGPMFGQMGHFFKFAADKTSDDYAVNRYLNESKRLLKVLDDHLAQSAYLAGDTYSIADIATFPWVNALDFYGAKDLLEYASFSHVKRWSELCNARPAAQTGSKIGSLD